MTTLRPLLLVTLLAALGCEETRPVTGTRFELDARGTSVRRLRTTYTLRNESQVPVGGVELWLTVPRGPSSSQSLRSLELSHPGTLHENAVVIPVEIPPLGTRIIRADFELGMVDAVESRIDADAWLAAAPAIEAGASEVKTRAAALQRDDVMTTARAMHDFVAGHLVEGGYDATDRGASWALAHRSGDCSEFSSLFVALARANGVPSRRVSGYACAGPCRGALYHSWAEFHDGERWHSVDPQHRVFDDPRNYLALELDEERIHPALQNHHRFRLITPPGANVKVESVATVD